MAHTGRPPTPTALKMLRGNPGRRGPNTAEPQPAELESLSEPTRAASAGRLWAEVAPELKRLQLLKVIDPRRLHRACRLEALGLRYFNLAERAPMAETPSNGRQGNAALLAAITCFKAADQVWRDFGVGSPSERARLHAPAPKGLDEGKSEDPYEAFRAKQRQLRGAPGG